jgi:hypothetical protein
MTKVFQWHCWHFDVIEIGAYRSRCGVDCAERCQET